MGCSTSKLDDDDQIPTQLRPFGGRIKEMKQRRRVRHASIVSTTELLRPEDYDGHGDDSVKKVHEETMMMVAEEEDGTMKGEMVKRSEEDELLPGSPSFRIYFTEAAGARDFDDDSVRVIQKIKEERLAQEKERTQAKEVKAHGRQCSRDSLISNEGSSHKPHKKDRGRRFKDLTKAPSRMYSFLSVKNCYGPSSTTDTTSEESPHTLHHAMKST